MDLVLLFVKSFGNFYTWKIINHSASKMDTQAKIVKLLTVICVRGRHEIYSDIK